jgi:uncharacterized phage protein (TIGR02218 family)
LRTELYKFIRGTQVWTLTSANESIDYSAETYVPAIISRGARESRAELTRSSLPVTIDIDETLAQDILSYYGDEVMFLTLFINTGGNYQTGWKGRLVSKKPKGQELQLTIESLFTTLRRSGVMARYQRTCRHALYRLGCNLNQEDFVDELLLISASGNQVTVVGAAAQGDGYYTGGMLRAPQDDSLRWVTGHTGDVLTMGRAFEVLNNSEFGYGNNYGNFYGGYTVKAYPGCDHTRPTCVNKFSNVENYGGFPWIPSLNPFSGRSII